MSEVELNIESKVKMFQRMISGDGIGVSKVDECLCVFDEYIDQLRQKLEAAELELKIAQGERDGAYKVIREAREQKPFAYCFTDVNGKPKDFCDSPETQIPQDRRVITALFKSPVPAMPIQDDKWVHVDEAFLKNKPEWFHGNLWVSFACEKPVFGKYEWVQGWSPDRIITDCGSDYEAMGIWVRPAVIPAPPPQSEVKPS